MLLLEHTCDWVRWSKNDLFWQRDSWDTGDAFLSSWPRQFSSSWQHILHSNLHVFWHATLNESPLLKWFVQPVPWWVRILSHLGQIALYTNWLASHPDISYKFSEASFWLITPYLHVASPTCHQWDQGKPLRSDFELWLYQRRRSMLCFSSRPKSMRRSSLNINVNLKKKKLIRVDKSISHQPYSPR